MKAKDTSSDNIKKFIYYLDEVIVFLITIFAIVFDKTILKLFKTGLLDLSTLHITWPQVIAASFITIIIYGITNHSFKYNEKDKPHMLKRVYTAVFLGIGWQAFINMYLNS